jgi:hypothetical protein
MPVPSRSARHIWIVVVEPRKDEIKQMACGDRAGQARSSRAARGRRSCANPQLEYRRWESNPHGRFRPEDFKSSASAIPPRRLLRRSIDRQEMPQKERAEPARPVRDRRWSDSQSIGPERWNSNPRPARTSPPLPRHSSPATNLLGKSKACNRSTWAVRARRSPTGPWSQWCRGAHRATSRLARSIWTFSLVMEAEGVGFEPTDRRNLSTVFKTVPINHSGTPPKAQTIDR